MRCKKIRDLILTDYSDGEVDNGLKAAINGHLKVCSGCREFQKLTQESAIEPMRQAQALKPPESLWQNIHQTILSQQEYRQNRLRNIQTGLKAIFLNRKPLLATASSLVVILIAISFIQTSIRKQALIRDYIIEQAAFYSSLDNGNNFLNGDSITFDTNIEDFFL